MRRAATRLLILLALIAQAGAADVQETATLEGRVLDPSGGPIPGVAVLLSSPRGHRTVSTDPEGSYRIAALVPDEYEVSVELDGFPRTSATTRVKAGEHRKLDLKLSLATSASVEVVDQLPLVNPLEAGVSSSLIAETAEEITYRTRNFQSAFTSFAGTVQSVSSLALAEHRPSINGSQWQETAGYVDGVDTSNTRSGGSTRLFIPTSALAEINLDGAGYEVAYGRSAGGVFNAVVKSGSNRLHGSLSYIPQAESWRAPSEVTPLERSDEIKSSYELSLGGPVVRDRLWFFAAAAENNTNQIDVLADGTVLDNSLRQVSRILKLTAQPGDDHYLSLTAIDAPAAKVLWDAFSADIFTPGDFDLEEELIKFGWNWTVSSRLHLDLKMANYTSTIVREALAVREVDPTASIDSPLGNRGLYRDEENFLKYNSLYLGAGPGSEEFPRRQVSATIDWALGRHALEMGVDFQNLTWRSTNNPPPLYSGAGYDESLPGGFLAPISKRRFIPQEVPAETSSTIASVFVQDRLSLGERWTLLLGLRVDDQIHRNDVGEKAAQSTDLSPRLAAVFDASGNGRVLIKATLGRYLQMIPLNLINKYLARLPNGVNSWVETDWNSDAQLYDLAPSVVLPPEPNEIQSFDPYYKDELTVGVDWSLRALWTATARLIYWTVDDLYWANEQFDEDGQTFLAIRNYGVGDRTYRGLQLGIDRRLAGDMTVSANYTLSRLDGNMFPVASVDEDTLFEGLGGVDDATGRTDLTSVNRSGPGNNDRTHNLNITVVKHWHPQRHTLSLGTFLMMRSGEPWGFVGPVLLRHPESGKTIRSRTYLEPRGTRRLHSTFALNLTGAWTMPVSERFEARLRIEVANITDEQEQVFVNPATGQPSAGRISYQSPRELRLMVGIYF